MPFKNTNGIMGTARVIDTARGQEGANPFLIEPDQGHEGPCQQMVKAFELHANGRRVLPVWPAFLQAGADFVVDW